MKCLEIDEKSTAANAVYPVSLYCKSKHEEAIKYGKIVVESDDVDMHTHFNCAYFNILIVNYESAEEILQQIKIYRRCMIKGIERIRKTNPESVEFRQKYINQFDIDKAKDSLNISLMRTGNVPQVF